MSQSPQLVSCPIKRTGQFVNDPLTVIILFVIGHLSKKTYGLISGHRGGDKCLCKEAPLPTHKTRLPHSNRDYPHRYTIFDYLVFHVPLDAMNPLNIKKETMTLRDIYESPNSKQNNSGYRSACLVRV